MPYFLCQYDCIRFKLYRRLRFDRFGRFDGPRWRDLPGETRMSLLAICARVAKRIAQRRYAAKYGA